MSRMAETDDIFHSKRAKLIYIDDVSEEIKRIYKNGLEPGLSTGWRALDQYYTIRKKEWTLITGIPGHGKTALLDGIIHNMARIHDWKFAIYSAENQPVARHVKGLIEYYAEKTFNSDAPKSWRITPEEIADAQAFYSDHVVFVDPDDTNVTVDSILEASKKLKGDDGFGLDAIVMDPWNYIDQKRTPGKTETEYISEALSKVAKFARRENVHIFIVAHPAKMKRDDQGQYPVPTPYDVSGSAHWRNKADNCLAVWRDVTDNDSPNVIHVQKVRFRDVGKVGSCELRYKTMCGRLIEEA